MKEATRQQRLKRQQEALNAPQVLNLIDEYRRAKKHIEDNYFSPKQAALCLDTTEDVLKMMRRDGTGPKYYKSNFGRIFYKIEDVRRYLYDQIPVDESEKVATS